MIDLTPEGILNFLQEQAPVGPAEVAKGALRGKSLEALNATGLNVQEAVRQKSGELERARQMPPKDSTMQLLRTAYHQAGEGFLTTMESRNAWREYERHLSKSEEFKRKIRRRYPAEVRGELVRAERYRSTRRRALAKAFPALDVEALETAERRGYNYKPKTQEGRERFNKLYEDVLREKRRPMFQNPAPSPRFSP